MKVASASGFQAFSAVSPQHRACPDGGRQSTYHTDVSSGAGAAFPRGGRVDVGIAGTDSLARPMFLQLRSSAASYPQLCSALLGEVRFPLRFR